MWFFPTGRVEKLEAEIASLKRDMQTRDLDWLDMRARCKRLLDRTQKASEYAELRAQEGAGAESGGTPLATTLSPRARLIQQQILAARAAKQNGGEK